ncbi:hypothetical protein [Sandaracinus amylolyticus]|uniref:Uncharacterized protein n=1 Tax=Sandaracinus amylolyticus TaxID=927083 RepID=A0A0F6SFD6_9BACT|nr:hypothetical protein [Sandaracinus amylolyticus]AKF06759.1 hypothetical protein DB32_003908 [Sandaracinus amylolyticus]
MATSKKTTRKATTARPSPTVQIAERSLAALAPLREPERAAFLAQTTPEDRAALGARTRADGVLRDLGPLIAHIDASVAKYGTTIRYGAPRRAFLAQTTLELADALATATGKRDGATSASAQRNAALRRGRAVFGDLAHALSSIARGSAEAARLDAVERDFDHEDTLARGLRQLAELARGWIERARTDEAARALVAGAHLTEADVTSAERAAEALLTAGADRVGSGRASANDPPEVNVLEGIVLAEAREAWRAFEAARSNHPSIPRLPLGTALRQVIGTRPKRAKPKPAAPKT